MRRGFTLIELMVVVAIVGVLSVLAMYGVSKYVANAKTAEARAAIGQIAKSAVVHYEEESGTAQTVNLGSSGANVTHNLCRSAIQVPTPGSRVQAKKYQSNASDWRTGDRETGWACLRFSIDSPQAFAYRYTANNVANPNTGTFVAWAHGDLNGDSVTSTFAMAGGVTSGQARIAPSIAEIDGEE